MTERKQFASHKVRLRGKHKLSARVSGVSSAMQQAREYGWFSEGLDRRDLKVAKALPEQLAI